MGSTKRFIEILIARDNSSFYKYLAQTEHVRACTFIKYYPLNHGKDNDGVLIKLNRVKSDFAIITYKMNCPGRDVA